MSGERLLLHPMKRPGEKWLLSKRQDDHAGAGNALVERWLTSELPQRAP